MFKLGVLEEGSALELPNKDTVAAEIVAAAVRPEVSNKNMPLEICRHLLETLSDKK
jgi:hypothetical protein